MGSRFRCVAVGLAVLVTTACGGGDSPGRVDRGSRAVEDTRLVGLGAASPKIGLADNRPETLSDRRFVTTAIKRARVVVPYDDVSSGGARLAVQDAWFKAARAAGVEPLVSFYRSYRDPRVLPGLARYARGVRAFRRRYPWVRAYSVWSEPNSGVQPTVGDPRRTGAYYGELRRQCRRRCTVLAGDYRLDAGAASRRWLARYQRAIGPGRHLWGLSAFEDVSRRSTSLTRAFLHRTRGPVWVDEVGAVRPAGPRGGESQRRQMAFLVDKYARLSPRIKRIYIYHWRAVPGERAFDSALLNVDGTPRPAYRELNRGIGRLTP